MKKSSKRYLLFCKNSCEPQSLTTILTHTSDSLKELVKCYNKIKETVYQQEEMVGLLEGEILDLGTGKVYDLDNLNDDGTTIVHFAVMGDIKNKIHPLEWREEN